MGLTHSDVLVNADALCEIDIHTRKINRKSKKSEFQQYDHNSERIGFTMERMNDGHDMSQCDRVAIKYLNVRQDDMYIVDDVSVSEDGKHVTFTWLVSANATQEVGSLAFLVNFRCWNDEGDITYNWSTHPCSTYSILKGVPSMDSNPKEQYDFWAKYKGLVDGVIEDTEKVSAKLGALTEDAEELEERVDELTKNSNSMTTKVNELSTDVPVLESRVSFLSKELPELENRVASINRTLEDDVVLAINNEISDIETALANRGRINFDLNYNTAMNGTVYEEPNYTRLMITEMVDCSEPIKIVNNTTDYMYGIIYYESDKTWSRADPGWMNHKEYELRNYGYAYVNFKRNDDSTLSDEDILAIKENFEICRVNYEFAEDSELRSLSFKMDTLLETYDFNDFVLDVGTISGGIIQLGVPARCCTIEYIKVHNGMRVVLDSTDYYYGVACFDRNKVYDGVDHGWTQRDFIIDFDGYILINFRRSDNAYITESDKEAVKRICSVKNYSKYSADVEEYVKDSIESSVSDYRAMDSIMVEYGRRDGSSYVFCRIPKTLNDGRTIMPKVRLTSADGSLTGSKRSTLTYARATNSIFAINAGLFDMTKYIPVGQTILDGVSVVNTPMEDDNGSPISDTECYPLCIDANGVLSAPYARSVDTAAMIADGVTQAVTGWGKIVENFEIMLDDINAEIVHQGNYIRQSIGQYQNGDYAVCTVDMTRGSVENEAGLTYEALAQIFIDHGVKFAYSLDGGGSAQTVIGKRQLNPIYEGTTGRRVPTVISFEVVD